MLNVFIADDSILIRNVVEEILSTDKDLRIIGKAANGADAVTKVLSLHPDIVIMDLDMPIMNGLEACAKIVEASSIPVLIFTHNTDPELPFKALELGAIDFLLKPDFNDLNKPDYVETFISKLKVLASRHVLKPNKTYSSIECENSALLNKSDLNKSTEADDIEAERKTEKDTHSLELNLPNFPNEYKNASMIVVGASTGGPQAVSIFLSSISKPFPLPITLVQHIETGFDKGYADWLTEETGHKVILAKEGVNPESGIVYVAPTDFHLKFERGMFILDNGNKVLNQKPAVDVLFKSAADNLGRKVIAVLLTGMGTDGAEGCAQIQAHGGYTIVQNEASSLIYGMPKAAIERGAASIILPLDKIGPFIENGIKD